MTPNDQSTQDISSERNSRLEATLAQFDRDETEVVKRREAIDQDGAVPSKNVELVDREADLLKRQQELAHQAFGQSLAGVVESLGAVGSLQDLQDQSGLTLAEMTALVDMQRAQSAEGGTGAQQDLAVMQDYIDTVGVTAAEMENIIAQMQATQQAYSEAIARNRG